MARDFAQKNLVIGVTGAKTARTGLPSYTFVDNGEGQDPDAFEDTFLSLSSGNKKDIRLFRANITWDRLASSDIAGCAGSS